ncbi:hypothetical protein JOC45_001858 [Gordonia hydrophobica]|nr:hypothetical protein [Gordonia hydrophobica]
MDPDSPELDTPVAEPYDYPTEPIAADRSGTTPTAAGEPTTASGVSWSTVMAAGGAAAVVAALILAIGTTGLYLLSDRTPARAAPATVVQLGDTAPVAAPTTGAQTTAASTQTGADTAPNSSTGPTAAATDPVAPADVPAAQAPAATSTTTSAPPDQSTPGNPNFRVTADRPTLTDLTNIVDFLVASRASDQAKAANVEGGMSAVVVPKTVYTLGLFRPPLGWNKVTGPLVQNGTTVSATLNSGSAGRPTIRMTIQFKKISGNWRLAASSMCEGVKTVGLNIYCNA